MLIENVANERFFVNLHLSDVKDANKNQQSDRKNTKVHFL
jgi:hypothetical protein